MVSTLSVIKQKRKQPFPPAIGLFHGRPFSAEVLQKAGRIKERCSPDAGTLSSKAAPGMPAKCESHASHPRFIANVERAAAGRCLPRCVSGLAHLQVVYARVQGFSLVS